MRGLRAPLTRRFHVLLVLAMLLGCASALHAATATWNPNPETNIAGYILSYGTLPGVHPTSIDVGNVTTWQVTGLTPGRYYFVVQAYNTSSEVSQPSTEVIFDEAVSTNRPPSLTQPVNQTSAENATISLPLVASDPDGNTLTYSVTGLPAALSVTSSTGIIAGTLTFTSAGTYSVTATVSDGVLTDSKTFTWTVTNVNRAPVLTQPVNQTSAESATISLPLEATDPDGTPLTYSVTGLPSALSVTPSTGIIAGTLSATSAGTYSVTATVSDGALAKTKTFTWTVTHVLQGPGITSLSPTSGAAGATVTIIGTNFGSTQGSSEVKFNGTVAIPTSWSGSSIVVLAPGGATTGSVVVTVGGVASNGVKFSFRPVAVKRLRRVS